MYNVVLGTERGQVKVVSTHASIQTLVDETGYWTNAK